MKDQGSRQDRGSSDWNNLAQSRQDARTLGTLASLREAFDPTPSRPIGLLAGAGRFPIVFAEKARQAGIPVVCVGVRDAASPELIGLTHRFHWTGVAQLGRVIRCFKREGVERAVMAGKILKSVVHTRWRVWRLRPDWRMIR